MSRRVVVTGLGLLSPAGEGPGAHLEALLAGRSAVGGLSRIDPGPLPFRAAGQVEGFKPARYLDNRKNLKLMTRAVRLGMAAAHLAMEDAALAAGDVEPVRFAIFVGAPHAYGESKDLVPALEVSTIGGALDLVAFGREGLPNVSPLWLLKGLSNNVLGFTSLRYKAMGPNANLSAGAAGGLQAVGAGHAAILSGRADVALCGGYDSLVCLEALTGYGRLGLLSTADRAPETSSRPFDRDRDGFVPSEGGAFVVLEAAERAAARNARAYGEVCGAADACDAFDAIRPEPEGRGLALAARAALEGAGVGPEDLALVVAHASGTRDGDLAEARALQGVLAGRAGEVPVTAPMGLLGHTVAASGAFGLAAALLLRAADRAAPTANLDTPDPDCDLCHVVGEPAQLEDGKALVQATGLGGQASAVVVGRA